ncbi:SusC/RagA family TonB-linked outer membrane protein [Chitinophaga agrisoli]|uniref:SusC/RagA family TonB-linked outer membrane protein n=1 Tax=Chitinophaga agrisoli TaxID=2607653 RepID=A0A5B2VQ02_9BACT|nr:SusC/RagA family TonB-linked outer membrane protein [Chitinophaga agrisoli]KAA2241843.1 SusC/RagA family TonB-linked outer membrane protein [Chitinophaga agrisoli]
MKRSLLVCAVLFLLCANFVLAQEKKTVAGIVQDEKGLPLVGVSIQEKGSNTNGTLTDANGTFKLSVSTDATLLFTYVGYMRQEVPLNGRVSLAMKMMPDSKGLNEIVVTALGIKRERRKLGYAIANVSGEDMIKASPTNFGSALYGRAAGVSVQSAPGGATSAVILKIRGVNTLNGDNQPLIVVDGVPIRNDANFNSTTLNSQYDRIRGNSLLDINPENIQDVSILKGAAATALYGSNGSNGVVLITTKQGTRRQGIGVDFNYSYGMEKVAFLPEYQTSYGPGYGRNDNPAGYDKDGWSNADVNGDGKPDLTPFFGAYSQFGPKFDGRDFYYWDGTTRKYQAHPDNWKKFYRTGGSSIANVAINSANERGSIRFSYTRNDYKGIQLNSKQEKNTFNLNTSYKITPKLTTDFVVNYVNEFVHNRPDQIHSMTGSYGGFVSPADDMDVFFNKYKTSKGYKFAPYDNTALDPEEALKYRSRTDLLSWMWNQLQNSYDERTNRVVSSATVSYEINKNIKVRGRFGNDFTGYGSEQKNYAEYPLAFGASGAYAVANNQYNISYADLLATYNKEFSPKFGLSFSAGYQARREDKRYNYASTRDGLIEENWFTINASKSPINPNNDFFGTSRTSYLQDGIFGILGLSYRNFLFLEATERYERISTLAPGHNAYFYPSVSLSFELSKALHMPRMVDYSKLRLSYGVAATPPDLYKANIVYSGTPVNGVAMLYPPSQYGNNDLEPEFKHEFEVGWETKMFENRFGFDFSFYNSVIKGQIVNLTVPTTVGARSIWQNVGDLGNQGLELAIYGTPIAKKNFDWSVRGNLGFNQNKLKSLRSGVDQMRLTTGDLPDGGSFDIVANVGQAAGDIMVRPFKKDAQGQFITDAQGFYITDFTRYEKAGNIQPKMTGGIANTIRYKNWSLDFLVDFRWGGQMLSLSNFYNTGAGMFKSTMKYRDEANGGITYYEDATGNRTRMDKGASAPAGATVFHDGVVLDGVDENGKKNEKILTAAQYYVYTFQWGNYASNATMNSYSNAVYDNNFIKFREFSLNYTLPVGMLSKLKIQKLTVGIFGRNLFYFYKTLPNLDPEAGIGSSFVTQGVESGTMAPTRTLGANLRLSF